MPETCPKCGAIFTPRNPYPTADIIIYDETKGIVLVKRRFEPLGWALPGGFVEYGETVENTAIREAKEETSLDVELSQLFGVYSDPARDPREHTMSTVFIARTNAPENIHGGDDAEKAYFFPLDNLPKPIVFDHERIIADFIELLQVEG